ncbi:hypothetical protein GCM10020295_49950 [Streptomyces cinereospinus]
MTARGRPPPRTPQDAKGPGFDPGPFSLSARSEQLARGPPQVVLVDDRLGVAVRQVVLVAQPADLLLEAESGAFLDGAQPVADFATGAMGGMRASRLRWVSSEKTWDIGASGRNRV